MLTIIGTTIAGTCTAASLLSLGAVQIHGRRNHRRRVRAARRLEEVVNEHWYPAARSFESAGTARAFQLRTLGQATLEIAKELAALDDGTGLVPEWTGPPFKLLWLHAALAEGDWDRAPADNESEDRLDPGSESSSDGFDTHG
jgi:hypothetical protein